MTDHGLTTTDHRFMNCEICQTELEDLLYGELGTARRAALTGHLSACSDCREVQARLERENELFAAYYEQNALEPSDEMWQSINGRINEQEAQTTGSRSDWITKLRSLFQPLLAPAMLRQVGFAACLVLLSVGLTTLYFSTRNEPRQVAQGSPAPIASVAPTPAPIASPIPAVPAPTVKEKPQPQLAAVKPPATRKVASSKPAQLSDEELLTQQIALATHEYQGAIKLLERTIAKRKTNLDENTVKQFESSLALIDASITASREARQAHPNDPTAARYLLAAYAKKVELMQEIAMR